MYKLSLDHALKFAKNSVDDEPLKIPQDAQEVIFDLCEQLLFIV